MNFTERKAIFNYNLAIPGENKSSQFKMCIYKQWYYICYYYYYYSKEKVYEICKIVLIDKSGKVVKKRLNPKLTYKNIICMTIKSRYDIYRYLKRDLIVK